MKATSINDPGVTGSLYVEKEVNFLYICQMIENHLNLTKMICFGEV